MQTLLISAVLFGVLIAIHELGHFLLAKATGVTVHEFSLGYGPRLLMIRRGETEYSVRLIPWGGYVRMAGLQPGADDWEHEGAFHRRTVGQRMAVMAAGPAMNLVLAAVLFAGIFAVAGMTVPTLEVREAMSGYPAAVAGLREGDIIIAIENTRLRDWSHLVEIVQRNRGVPLRFLVERAGRQFEVTVTPVEHPELPGKGFVGIGPRVLVRRPGPVAALWYGLKRTFEVSVIWIRGLVLAILGRVPADFTGPVGIAQLVGEAARVGWTSVFYLAGVLSANLALLNLLPVPALDGSRLLFLSWEALRREPVDPEKENFIHLLGFVFLVAVALIITYRDILRLGGGS